MTALDVGVYVPQIGQIVLFTHDRASDATLDLLAAKVICEL